jgi:outer membrane receptor protein involved in Fe transport
MSNSEGLSNGTIRHTVAAILLAAAGSLCASALAQEAETAPAAEPEPMAEVTVVADPLRAVTNEPVAVAIGFPKPILETPRSVSFVSEQQISTLNISNADDIQRVVPGTFTNRRWGLLGGVDVRGVSADLYFRGMRRLQMQGHGRTSFAGMDAIEVVKGPPSVVYGMGRIGGYLNLVPKAGRAGSGKYTTENTGWTQAIIGSYDKAELSFGLGGPVSIGEKEGGYYAYGLMEDSNTFVEPVGVKQKLLQAATSVDDMVGPFRLETGGQYQNSTTSGAYMTRATQELIDDGLYIRGVPLVNLDANGDGQVGWAESATRSPVRGNLTTTNQPLSQRFAWPTIGGAPVAWDGEKFPTVNGIPAAMLSFLNSTEGRAVANCHAADVMRAMTAGGPVPTSGLLPVGFVLNPCTVSKEQVNRRRGAYEKRQDAQMYIAFADLVYDSDPDFTVKNQMYYDRLESSKNSQLPYGERQSIWAAEDKLTVTRRINGTWMPSWLAINSLASANYRITNGYIASGGGDYDYRNDIMSGDGLFGGGALIPNASFWNNLEDESYETGAPKTQVRKSRYTEVGVGAMFDIDFFEKLNLMTGARYDWSDAMVRDGYRFQQFCTAPVTCTSASPIAGQYLPEARAVGHDKGLSYNASLSYQLPWGIRPYVTYSKSSSVLDQANNTLDRPSITAPGGYIGEAVLKEVGIKFGLLDGKMLITTAAYDQQRTDLSNPDDPTAGADATSTQARGIEAEVKWVPTKDIFLSVFGLVQDIKYIFATSANIEMTGRQLGYQDVFDPVTGALLYPAEAFLYGGRVTVALPTSLRSEYMDFNGKPSVQVGLNGNYQITPRFSVNIGAQYYSKVDVTRIGTLTLPSGKQFNAGVAWNQNNWLIQLSGSNLTDEVLYKARNGDTVSGLLSALPDRTWQLTVKHDFK